MTMFLRIGFGIFVGLLFAFGLYGFAPTAQAQSIGTQYDDIMEQGIIFANICDSKDAVCDCRDHGQCTLEDGLQVFVNISVFILGISGTILLLILFYGGFMWITAHGKPEMVEKGRQAIVGGVVGLAIIFSAYSAVTLLVKVLKTGEVTQPGENLEDVTGGAGVITTIENP